MKVKSIISNVHLVANARFPLISRIPSSSAAYEAVPSQSYFDISSLDPGKTISVDVCFMMGPCAPKLEPPQPSTSTLTNTTDTSTSTSTGSSGSGIAGGSVLNVPVEMAGEVVAFYSNPQNAQRGLHARVQLPLQLVMKFALPKKDATFKVTIESDKPPVDLTELFQGSDLSSDFYLVHICKIIGVRL